MIMMSVFKIQICIFSLKGKDTQILPCPSKFYKKYKKRKGKIEKATLGKMRI